jgi:hypothetical protein
MIESMPRNPVGKIKKFMLRERAQELSGQAGSHGRVTHSEEAGEG